MSEFHRVTPSFAVAPQITIEDVARAAAEGFVMIVKNRPEGEDAGQIADAEIRAAVETAGLAYKSLPFAGPPPPGIVAETAEMLEDARGPVLAYCRTGTRSVTVWAMAQALRGALTPDEILAAAARAGYNLAGVQDVLERLAPH